MAARQRKKWQRRNGESMAYVSVSASMKSAWRNEMAAMAAAKMKAKINNQRRNEEE
jgi:hypothetical protein